MYSSWMQAQVSILHCNALVWCVSVSFCLSVGCRESLAMSQRRHSLCKCEIHKSTVVLVSHTAALPDLFLYWSERSVICHNAVSSWFLPATQMPLSQLVVNAQLPMWWLQKVKIVIYMLVNELFMHNMTLKRIEICAIFLPGLNFTPPCCNQYRMNCWLQLIQSMMMLSLPLQSIHHFTFESPS